MELGELSETFSWHVLQNSDMPKSTLGLIKEESSGRRR